MTKIFKKCVSLYVIKQRWYLDLFDVYISMDYHKIVLTLSLLILSNWMAPAFFIFTLLFYPLLNFMTRFRIIGLWTCPFGIVIHLFLRLAFRLPDPLLINLIFLTLGLWIRYSAFMFIPPNRISTSNPAVKLFLLLNPSTKHLWVVSC